MRFYVEMMRGEKIMVNENRQLLKSLDNSDLSAIEKDKKQFELKLTQLIDNIINLENTLKEQKIN